MGGSFFLLLLVFFLGGRIQRGEGLVKFWGKMRDGPDGGRRKEGTEH